MIILREKPFEEVLKMVQEHERVLVVGCNGCAGIYQVGGEKQAELMGMLLDMAMRLKGLGVENKAMTTLRQCDRQIVSTSISPLVEDYEAILSMACGVGVQTIAEVFQDKTVIPANDTIFIGMQDRESGKFYELCSACGECLLGETAGICPVTRCAKGLMNGPCGGCVDGKCEVPVEIRDEGGRVLQTIEQDCAWYLIYERLKRRGRIDLFRKYRPPRDRSVSGSPRIL